MKKFFLSDVKESSMQAAYLFIAANLLWFIQGVAELDYGNFGNLLQLFWSFSFAGILLGLKDLHGEAIPEDWRQGYTMLAAIVFLTSILGSVNEDLNTTGVWTIVGFAIISLGVTSDGVIGNIWRYAAIIAGLFMMVSSGAEYITGNQLVGEDNPIQFVGWVTFIAGVGIGPLLAWREKV